MLTKAVIKELNERFPNINAVDYSEWDETVTTGRGIWLRNGDEHLEFTPWGDLEATKGEVYDYLNSVGWFLEPYDSMTMMAWEG